jgi:putative ABC transport system permease protein
MFGETIRLSFRAILRNALRSILTVLGIVIGVGAVIVMVTVGQGSTAQVTDDVATLGSNLLMVQPGQARRGPAVAGAPADNFTIKDVDAIESQIPGVLAAAPTNARAMTAIAGNANHATTVTGSDNRYFIARDWAIAGGRDFTESELRLGTAVCILGETVREELFGSSDPVGEIIRLKQMSCRVIGLLAKKGASAFGNDQDDAIIMPLRAFQRRIAGNRDVAMMFVAVRDGYETAKVQSDVESLMRERRRIALGETDNFNVLDMKEIASILTSITTVLTGLLAAVAGVSLLVGGIGIMNIMLVSVTERTREIGIRLAVGAEARQVLMQFLVEAVVLSLFGGVLGILVGFGLGAVAANLLEVPFAVDPTIVAIAFLFSAAVGVVFGYFPARRAAHMNPIEALRHE